MAISRNARRRKSRNALGAKLNREALLVLRDAKRELVNANLTHPRRERPSVGVSGIYAGNARPMGRKRPNLSPRGAANVGQTVTGLLDISQLRPAHKRDWNK